VEELEALAGVRLEPQVHFGELAAAAGLFLVAVLALGALLDRLPVRQARAEQLDLDVEARLETIDHDVELQVAHAVHDRLVRRRLDADRQRRALLVPPPEGHADLPPVALALRAKSLGDRGPR